MVALSVIAIVLCALTADYVVQRLALRAARQPDEGYFLHPNHLWVRPEPSGLASVGADSVIGLLLGRRWRVEWKPLGAIKRGEPLAVIHAHGRSLTLRAPVDGEVVAQNTQHSAFTVHDSPEALDTGWLVRLRPVALASSLASMRTNQGLREWLRGEMERLRAFVLSRIPAASVGATATDGGPLAGDLSSLLDDAAWNEAVGLMLGVDYQEQVQADERVTASAGGQS